MIVPYVRDPQTLVCRLTPVRGLLGTQAAQQEVNDWQVKLHLLLPIAHITPTSVPGKIIFQKTHLWCQKDWGPLL